MGAKTCKCNIGSEEEEQLKLSREQNGDGNYDFPSGGAAPKDVAVSALHGSSSSSHVLPLPPNALSVQQDADAAAGISEGFSSSMSGGKLPTVPEANGEDFESSSRGNGEDFGDSGDTRGIPPEQLQELKEALLECVDSSGQLAAAPGEGKLEALAARSSSAASRHNSLVELQSADDTGAAARRQSNLGTSDDPIIGMALPAAAHLAIDTNEARGGQEHELQQSSVAVQNAQDENMTADDGSPQAASDAQFNCWSLMEKNSGSCVCPLGGGGSLELRRDGRAPSEHYDLHGTRGAPSPKGVSALTIPPEPAQVEIGQSTSRPESSDAVIPPPDSASPDPDGDALRAAAQDSTGPIEADSHDERAVLGIPPQGQETRNGSQGEEAVHGNQTETDPCEHPTEGEGLDGEWQNDSAVNIVKNNVVIFASGEQCPLEPTSQTTCHMVLEGTVYYGRLTPRRQRMLWSDGDVWVRVKTQTVPEPAPIAQDAPAEPNENNSPQKEAEAPPADTGLNDPGGKINQEPSINKEGSAGSKKSENKQAAKDKSEANDAPPKKGLCGCFGGGGDKKKKPPAKKNSRNGSSPGHFSG